MKKEVIWAPVISSWNFEKNFFDKIITHALYLLESQKNYQGYLLFDYDMMLQLKFH